MELAEILKSLGFKRNKALALMPRILFALENTTTIEYGTAIDLKVTVCCEDGLKNRTHTITTEGKTWEDKDLIMTSEFGVGSDVTESTITNAISRAIEAWIESAKILGRK